MSQKSIADAMGLTEGRISQLKTAGMPIGSLAAARRWYRANVDPNKRAAAASAGDVKRLPGESFEQARTRERIALADQAEMAAGVQRGTLIETEGLKLELGRQFGAIREGLLAVADRVTPRPNLTGAQAAVIDAEIRAVLTQYVGVA